MVLRIMGAAAKHLWSGPSPVFACAGRARRVPNFASFRLVHRTESLRIRLLDLHTNCTANHSCSSVRYSCIYDLSSWFCSLVYKCMSRKHSPPVARRCLSSVPRGCKLSCRVLDRCPARQKRPAINPKHRFCVASSNWIHETETSLRVCYSRHYFLINPMESSVRPCPV
jgi:hypothetical protein